VVSVNLPTAGGPCYLVEWYRREFIAEPLEVSASRLSAGIASMCADGSPVRLVTILAVPTDEVVFAVFAAVSEDIVAEVCRRAGFPADRLSAAAFAAV
jgi:hypothetical protein